MRYAAFGWYLCGLVSPHPEDRGQATAGASGQTRRRFLAPCLAGRQKPAPTGLGMHGSGMFVINPPWTLPETLNTVMPALVDLFAQDDSARFGLDSLIP